MHKDIEIEGDLFKALCVVLGHVNKDSINKKCLVPYLIWDLERKTKSNKYLPIMI